MREVLAAIEQRRRRIDRHPLYAWIGSDAVPLEQRFVFAPLFANFILGFRDMNRWSMRYPQPQDAFEEAINRHTEEDETHAALFLEDWRELGLDDQLGWGVEETMAWYYAAPQTEVFRRYAMRIVQMCVEQPDPLVRFAVMEAIETCGHVFFSHTAGPAERLAARTGAALRYFGPFHLERETGALIDADSVFDAVVLPPDRRSLAIALVEEVFDMFTVKNDHLLAYARSVVASGPAPDPASALREIAEPGPAAPTSPAPAPPAAGHEPMAERLRERMDRVERHPFPRWISDGPGDPADRLAAILPLWIPDIMGYGDLMTYALPYRTPADEVERALNRRVRLLASHHRLFARDAAALRLNERLGWTAGDALHHLGHGPETDLQREGMASFLDAAYGNPSPVVRNWLVEALQGSGAAFFERVGGLARTVEGRDGLRLDYLADRHATAHPVLPADADADAVEPMRLPVSEQEQATCGAVIDLVFDQLERQFDQSMSVVTTGSTG